MKKKYVCWKQIRWLDTFMISYYMTTQPAYSSSAYSSHSTPLLFRQTSYIYIYLFVCVCLCECVWGVFWKRCNRAVSLTACIWKILNRKIIHTIYNVLVCLVALFLWHINFLRLFNAKAILLENCSGTI